MAADIQVRLSAELCRDVVGPQGREGAGAPWLSGRECAG